MIRETRFKQVPSRGQSAVLSLALALAIGLAGCSGGMMQSTPMTMTPGATVAFAFVSNTGNGSVSAFAVGSNGSLTAVAGSPFNAGSGAEFMAFDSVHNLLFVSDPTQSALSVFTVNTMTGMLTPVAGSPFATGSRPTGVAVDPLGHFVFVGNQNDSSVSVFNINGGALTPVAGSPFTGIASPFQLAVSPSGQFLFVNDFTDGNGTGANAVSTLAIGANGALTPVGTAVATSSPAGITAPIGLVTDGKLVFVGDHMAESVVPLNINSGTGALTPASALPAPAASCSVSCHHNPLRLAIDPMDRFVFATNVQAGTVSSFNINGGTLMPVTEVAAGQHPFGVATDPTGTFLFVVNKVDASISSFALASGTGMLSPMGGMAVTGNGLSAPTDIVIVAKH